MSGTINKGSKPSVEFGPYKGRAGMVDHLGVITVAFFGDAKVLAGITDGTIDAEPYRVTSVVPSDPKSGGIKGMVRLTVEPIAIP